MIKVRLRGHLIIFKREPLLSSTMSGVTKSTWGRLVGIFPNPTGRFLMIF